MERPEGPATAESFRALTGSDEAYDAWRAFYGEVEKLAGVIAPTLTEPLRTAREIAAGADPVLWRGLVQQPLSRILEERFADDLVRGVVATDALIGTFAAMDDPSLIQNRCFLYHLIGNGDGEWKVPVGGMGAATDALADAARRAGAQIVTGAGVSAIRTAGGRAAEVTWHDGSSYRTTGARRVLANVAPWVLRILLGEDPEPESKPAGAQLKINFLLSRLPALKSGDDPAVAFGGTFHVAEGYAELQTAYDEAAAGQIPTRPPGELYCHSLTDPSILGPLAAEGVHTLTYIGLHHARGALHRGPRGGPLRGGAPHDRDHRRVPRRTPDGLRAARLNRTSVHRGEGAAGRRGRSRDARRPHLPRRPGLAVGLQS
ncbi:MAG: hypothetical protein ABI873_09880 [Marmoricola sp.]